MKINSCYSILIALLTIPSLQGMQGPKKAIKKKLDTQRTLTPAHLVPYFAQMPEDKSSELNDLIAQFGNPLKLLHKAIKKKDIKQVKELLYHGIADPNKMYRGQTALHKAAQVADIPIELFRILLEKAKESVSVEDDENNVPLYRAIENMNSEVIQALLALDSPPFVSIIVDAVINADDDDQKDLDIITSLCKKYPSFIDKAEQQDCLGTALTSALEHGKINIINLLLEKGANPNTRDHDKVPPLFFAVMFNYMSIPSLVRCGANINNIAEPEQDLGFHGVKLTKGMKPADFARAIHAKGFEDDAWLAEVLAWLEPEQITALPSGVNSEKMKTD